MRQLNVLRETIVSGLYDLTRSEYFTLFIVYQMFALRNLMSTIIKALAYRMYKILTGSRDDSGSWPKYIFWKRYIVSLCPGVSLFPRLRHILVWSNKDKEHSYFLATFTQLLFKTKKIYYHYCIKK